MRYSIICKCVSHIGNHRSLNQDNFVLDGEYMDSQMPLARVPEQGVLAVDHPFTAGVFDGIGGEERGEVAAQIAAQRASKIALSNRPIDDLLQFCREANEEICRYVLDNDITAMGTTAAMLAFTKRGIVLCSIGDSKIFRIAKNKIEQLSVDHSSAAAYGRKPAIFQYLGIPSDEAVIEPYVAKGRYGKDDVYLICSDGLTDMVSRDRIREVILGSPLETAAEELMKAALDNGGKDNITIILCQIVKNKKNGVF